MSVVLVCPGCAQPEVLYTGSVPETCLRCGTPYPEAARAAAAAGLERDAHRRPLLLTLTAGFFGLWAAVATLIFTVSAFSSGSFTVNGQAVTKREFFADPTVLVMLLLIPVVGGIAWGLFRDRAWTRSALTGFAGVMLISVVITTRGEPDWIVAVLSTVPILAFGAWYLYGKGNVVAYYAAVARREGLASPAST